MMQYNLSDWMSLEVYRTLLVFVRVGAAFLLLPGFGEPSVPTRIRLLAALVTAIGLVPAIGGLPRVAPPPAALILPIVAEAVAGALLGILARTVISGVLLGGQIIGQNIGLANVLAPGITVDQSAAVGAAVYAGLVAIFFAAGGHHAVLRALAGSYNLLPAGQFPAMAPTARTVVAAGAECFRLGAQLALPFLILGIIFNVTLAAINRAMPGLPVFMLAQPVILVLGLYLLTIALPGIVDTAAQRWPDLPALMR